jgi:hypothetical protein
MKRSVFIVFFAAAPWLLGTISAPARAVDNCNMEVLTDLMKWCVDDGHEYSDYQRGGRDEIIEGRYCGKGGLVADGYLICQGHDPQAVALGFSCRQDQHLKAAKVALAESDTRRPEKCK